MIIARNILIVIYFIVCIVLTVLVLKQSKEDSGASGAVMGGTASNFYEKNKGRTAEGKMKRTTVILIVVFILMTLALNILSVV